ncbi:hypothetical protein [Yeosuana sp.]|uniref:hypothetical protein n=1 Tax=Yeosuana sp. TaxID=2529388 RepID=UPI004054C2BD
MPKYKFVAVHTWYNLTTKQNEKVTYRDSLSTHHTEELKIVENINDNYSESFIAKAKSEIGENIKFVRSDISYELEKN